MRRTIASGDRAWPRLLDELGPAAPAGLHVSGAPLDPGATAVAVVGTRRPTAAGREAAYEIARGLAEAGFVIVSGLAVGIDAVAHEAALDAGGATVAVLGCGLDVAYPVRNQRLRRRIEAAGTVVTEYPPGAPPVRHNFPARNRIIAGLCAGVVVIEGAVTSGALVTARLALDFDRNVYAVPGSIRNAMASGPNELIRAGRAGLVTCAREVIEDLAPGLVWDERRTECAPAPLAPDDADALALLDDVCLPADRIASALGRPGGAVCLALARLEVLGLCERGPAGYAITAAGARVRSIAGRGPADTATPAAQSAGTRRSVGPPGFG